MDQLINKVSSQAISFAIRSSISIASTFAIKKISKLINDNNNNNNNDTIKLNLIKNKLNIRILIITNAINSINSISYSNNHDNVKLINEIVSLINNFSNEIDNININDDNKDIDYIEIIINKIIIKIDEIIPLINLAINTIITNSNLNSQFSNALNSKNISLNLLINATNYINISNDLAFNSNLKKSIRISDIFKVSIFTLFNTKTNSNIIQWKEKFRLTNLSILQTPNTFNYNLKFIKNLNDGLYHNEEEEANELMNFNIFINDIEILYLSTFKKLMNLQKENTQQSDEESDEDDPDESFINENDPILILKVKKNKTDNKEEEKDNNDDSFVWYALASSKEVLSDSDEEEDDTYDGDETNILLLNYIIRIISLQNIEEMKITDINDEKIYSFLNNYTTSIQDQNNINTITENLKSMIL